MSTNFFKQGLQELQESNLQRSLRTVNSPQGREILLDGKKVLNFSSNDYLGLSNDERIKKAAMDAIETYGIGSGASRLICGNMTPHIKLEAQLALLKKTEGALVYSSGYMANAGIISSLMDRHSVVFSDKINHASIIDGIILSRAQLMRYPHSDMQALEDMLKSSKKVSRKLIVTDSVFSMDGDKALLKEIVDLAHRYEAMVMVDEAHAFGVLGEKGSGLVEELGLEDQIEIQMGTLSKAAGCFGAYVCTSKLAREYLINKSRSFMYTTAMPPSLAQAASVAIAIICEDVELRRRLKASVEYVRNKIQQMGFDTMNSTTPIIPIMIKDPLKAVSMSNQLLDQGIFVQAIRPPTVPEGTSRLRLTITAGHTTEDLDRMLDVLKGL